MPKHAEIRELPDDELVALLDSDKEELFNLRFQAATGKIASPVIAPYNTSGSRSASFGQQIVPSSGFTLTCRKYSTSCNGAKTPKNLIIFAISTVPSTPSSKRKYKRYSCKGFTAIISFNILLILIRFLIPTRNNHPRACGCLRGSRWRIRCASAQKANSQGSDGQHNQQPGSDYHTVGQATKRRG